MLINYLIFILDVYGKHTYVILFHLYTCYYQKWIHMSKNCRMVENVLLIYLMLIVNTMSQRDSQTTMDCSTIKINIKNKSLYLLGK